MKEGEREWKLRGRGVFSHGLLPRRRPFEKEWKRRERAPLCPSPSPQLMLDAGWPVPKSRGDGPNIYILGGRGRERVTVGFCLFPFWPPNYTYYLVTTSIYSTKIHPYLSLDYRLDQFETVETIELNCCVFSFSVDCVEWLSVLCVDDQKKKTVNPCWDMTHKTEK